MKKPDPTALRSVIERSRSRWFHFQRTLGAPTMVAISPGDDPDAPAYEYLGPFTITIRQERIGDDGGNTTVKHFSLNPDDTEQKGDPQ